MSNKKRFSISASLSEGLSDTINAVSNNAGKLRFEVIALSRIETDPDNPRELMLTPEEIKKGLVQGTSFLSEKQKEWEKLKLLAETIHKKGLINPVVVYKHGEKYRLVAGERRFLASLMAKKEDIQARILNEKPSLLDLRLLQWIENTEREDLSLKDRIGNVKSILSEYSKKNLSTPISTSLIKNLIGVSLSQASCYMAVLNTTEEIEKHIAAGAINNLDKAAFITKIEDKNIRKKAIESCAKGENLKAIRQLVYEEHKKKLQHVQHKKNEVSKKRGRTAMQVNLGATKNKRMVQYIIFSIIEHHPSLKHVKNEFKQVKWDTYEEVTQAFKKFITFLEKEGVTIS